MYAQLLPYAHKVEVKLDPARMQDLIFKHRNESWYAQRLQEALNRSRATGEPLRAVPGEPDAPAGGRATVAREDLKVSRKQEGDADYFSEAAIMARLAAKGMTQDANGRVVDQRVDYAKIRSDEAAKRVIPSADASNPLPTGVDNPITKL
jgi:hypothetical protein